MKDKYKNKFVYNIEEFISLLKDNEIEFYGKNIDNKFKRTDKLNFLKALSLGLPVLENIIISYSETGKLKIINNHSKILTILEFIGLKNTDDDLYIKDFSFVDFDSQVNIKKYRYVDKDILHNRYFKRILLSFFYLHESINSNTIEEVLKYNKFF